MVYPIRACHQGYEEYLEIFAKIAGMTYDDTDQFLPTKMVKPYGTFDWTDELTYARQKMVDMGYKKDVEQADKAFIDAFHGFSSQEAFEEFWDHFFANDEQAHTRNNAL